jgi:Protein of unknown function (DUF2628)
MSFIPADADPPLDQPGAPPIFGAFPQTIDRDDMALFESGGAAALPVRLGRNVLSPFGFFFPVVWFLYKKMYLQASAVVLVPIVLSLMHAPSIIVRGSGLVVSLLGAVGPRLHTVKARRIIAEIRAAAPDDATARLTIGQAGGVSTAGAVLGAFVTISVLMIAFVKL